MKVDIEELVSGAKEFLEKMREEKIGSDRVWCTTDEIKALLENKATLININQELIKKETYLHTVSYENITFVNVTEERVEELEKYAKKK